MAPAQDDEPSSMFIEMICAYSRFVLPALGMSFGDELEKVFITLSIPR
jgi:hypothetical protein